MAGQTLSEKLLSRKAGRVVRAGEIAICTVDFALGTDASVPMALDYFDAMGGTAPLHPEQLVFAFDHYAPAPSPKSALLQARIRKFASAHDVKVFDVGAGIGHQLMVEQGYARPGRLLVGADSHSVMYGAAGCFATGIGSSDLAAVMMTGKVWLKVPASIRVELVGRLCTGVGGKDIALALARILGADGAAYQTLEFHGDGIATLDFDDRLVIANMVIEMGAKNALFPVDQTVRDYLAKRPLQGAAEDEALSPDDDAQYTRRITLDLATVEPNVARPHQVDNVVTVSELEHTPIHMAYLGTCTGGRVKDFQEALAVLRTYGGPAPGVQLVVTPASREIMEDLVRGGELADFLAFGAIVVTPGCGSCCGTGGAIPGDGVNVVSTANRNFKGRMGNASANIYLASPQVCAASAVAGYLVAPSQLGQLGLGHRS
ncbi:3-isopropylmalate dehydratase large subunit [Pandoraea pneumonica]|uniref:3-isopropylmalate dehydratase large subunit n=1 Tax=Pandoraea pneumonica TaxID=2508299 RepID=UPI003CF2120E